MAQFGNTMDVFKLLKKNNCRECGEATCLAFATAVFQARTSLSECTQLEVDVKKKYCHKALPKQSKLEEDFAKDVEEYKNKISRIDLSLMAEKVGGQFSNGILTIKILGKNLGIDSTGNISTDLHFNVYIIRPMFNYVLYGEGLTPDNSWVSLRELDGGPDWLNFFNRMSVIPLKRVADVYPNFFKDIIELFNGKEVENHYKADISLIMYPLPKFPILMCYNKSEDGMESEFNLFFDSTADRNLPISAIYELCTGLAIMFEKLSRIHG